MIQRILTKGLLRHDVLAFFLCIAFFLIWPRFDLAFSQNFYNSVSNQFIWKDGFIANLICDITHYVGTTLVIGLPALLVASFLIKKDFLVRRRTMLFFLLSACILGPGLVVNVALKGHWERPRPLQIVEYGGEQSYEAPFSPTFECVTCRSFVSGHASVGFFFFSVALLTRRRKWLLAPVVAGGLIGLTRIAQGAHFFSDVIFSGWAVWFCSLILFSGFLHFDRPRPATSVVVNQ